MPDQENKKTAVYSAGRAIRNMILYSLLPFAVFVAYTLSNTNYIDKLITQRDSLRVLINGLRNGTEESGPAPEEPPPTEPAQTQKMLSDLKLSYDKGPEKADGYYIISVKVKNIGDAESRPTLIKLTNLAWRKSFGARKILYYEILYDDYSMENKIGPLPPGGEETVEFHLPDSFFPSNKYTFEFVADYKDKLKEKNKLNNILTMTGMVHVYPESDEECRALRDSLEICMKKLSAATQVREANADLAFGRIGNPKVSSGSAAELVIVIRNIGEITSPPTELLIYNLAVTNRSPYGICTQNILPPIEANKSYSLKLRLSQSFFPDVNYRLGFLIDPSGRFKDKDRKNNFQMINGRISFLR